MRRVLVVDDEFDIAEALVEFLRLEGFDGECASNGAEAIEKALAERPDVIVMDVMMPKLDGPATVERMRRDDRLREIPIILMSAVDPRAHAERLGCAAWLKKPFDLDGVLAVLRVALGPRFDADDGPQ